MSTLYSRHISYTTFVVFSKFPTFDQFLASPIHHYPILMVIITILNAYHYRCTQKIKKNVARHIKNKTSQELSSLNPVCPVPSHSKTNIFIGLDCDAKKAEGCLYSRFICIFIKADLNNTFGQDLFSF